MAWLTVVGRAPLSVGILTSVETRHRYFARSLLRAVNVTAVGYEQTGYAPASVPTAELTDDEARIVTHHFEERTRQETVFFGHDPDFVTPAPKCAVRQIEPGMLNSADTMALFEQADVDTVVVYGTNLIKAPLIDRWPGRMINMHLGLSPYYRGTATNFYPLLNDEPEYIGATIHLIDPGIDSGHILRHARPAIVAEDRPHTIGCKAIVAGIEAMLSVLRDLEGGRLNPVPQWDVPNARLYLRRDYHPRQVVELYRKLDAGLIPRYVDRAEQVAPRVRLVE